MSSFGSGSFGSGSFGATIGEGVRMKVRAEPNRVVAARESVRLTSLEGTE